MSAAFLSPSWYRVAQLKPRLHEHVRIHRQRFRGESWYVLADRGAARVHRFTPAAYAFIHLMDGEHTVDAIWNEIARSLGEAAPSQDDAIQLLYQLHAADVLQAGVPPDVAELDRRRRKQLRSVWMRNLMNPMALRLPLWDPDRFIERSWPALRWLFGPAGIVLWLAVVVPAAVLAWMHWRELTENVADRVLAFQNIVWLWLTYPIVKFCHEMGHAYAVKSGRGEVHEMGVMFLVFTPVPYVDATAAAGFRSKARRVLVGAIGMLVELFLAGLAMFVWLWAEPGLLRSAAFNVMLIGGVSTLAFNGNPLLRFDGYYILSDLIEIPNLAQRSTRYWAYLAKRYAFGKDDAESPAYGRGERIWFLLYGPISWLYRLSIMVSIAVFIAGRYFFAGVILAIWTVATMLLVPLAKSANFVFSSAEIDRQRARAVGVTLATLGGIAAACALVPAPSWTLSEGVVWVPENAEVRALAGGFVQRLHAAPGANVVEGQPLLEASDPELLAEIDARRARVEQVSVRLAAELFEDRVKAELTRQELDAERAVLERLERRADELAVQAGRAGRWVVPNAADLPGRFVAQGELIGYVLSGELRTLRVVVTQEDAERVRGRTRGVRIKLADRRGETYGARIVREVPGGAERLPTKALGLEGGGEFATDPRDTAGLKTLGRTFQFDLELEQPLADVAVGVRGYVRFDHQPEPIATQAYRRLRQLFLSQFHV